MEVDLFSSLDRHSERHLAIKTKLIRQPVKFEDEEPESDKAADSSSRGYECSLGFQEVFGLTNRCDGGEAEARRARRVGRKGRGPRGPSPAVALRLRGRRSGPCSSWDISLTKTQVPSMGLATKGVVEISGSSKNGVFIGDCTIIVKARRGG